MLRRRQDSIKTAVDGMTLPEVLIVVVILAIAGAFVTSSWSSSLRREKLNAVALEMAGWIEQVRNQAANQVSSVDTSGGCTIAFNNALSSAGPGAIVAGIKSGTVCSGLAVTTLVIPDAKNASFKICSNQQACGGGSGSGATQDITFTPRGMLIAEPALGASSLYEYRMILSDNSGPKRCVRISDITGTVEMGYGADANLATNCSVYGAL